MPRVGRPKLSEDEKCSEYRAIRLTKEQAKRWNIKLIKSVMDGDFEFLYNLIDKKFDLIEDLNPRENARILKIEEVLNIANK